MAPPPMAPPPILIVNNSLISLRKSHLSCRHLVLASAPAPLDLALYQVKRAYDPRAANSSTGLSHDFARHFYLPVTTDGKALPSYHFCRHVTPHNQVLHLPHTWLDCSNAAQAPHSTLFVNWETGAMQTAIPIPEPVSSAQLLKPGAAGRVYAARWSNQLFESPCGAFTLDISGDDVEDSALVGVDRDLWALVREVVASEHRVRDGHGGNRRAGLKIGSTFCRSRLGLRGVRTAFEATMERESTVSRAASHRRPDELEKLATYAVGVYVFPAGNPVVRRRAVLVAATYSNPAYQSSNPSPVGDVLHSTVNDAVDIHDMLVNQRGWRSEDIVLLTDVTEAEGVERVERLKERGVRVYGSSMKNVVLWLARLVSGLHAETEVSNSLVLFLAGHGAQYEELPTKSFQRVRSGVKAGELGHEALEGFKPFSVENDGCDESFWTSSIETRKEIDPQTGLPGVGDRFEYDKGAILDDALNSLLVEKVFCLPKTQLV